MHVSQRVWTRLVLDTGPAGYQEGNAARLLSPTLELTCMAEFWFPFPCLLFHACNTCFQCWHFTLSEIFFFNLCILITTSSISKGWMLWDNKMFPWITLLSLPLDFSINGMLLISRTKLSWFLYNLNLKLYNFSLKPLANLLPISRDTKLSQMPSGREICAYTETQAMSGESS